MHTICLLMELRSEGFAINGATAFSISFLNGGNNIDLGARLDGHWLQQQYTTHPAYSGHTTSLVIISIDKSLHQYLKFTCWLISQLYINGSKCSIHSLNYLLQLFPNTYFLIFCVWQLFSQRLSLGAPPRQLLIESSYKTSSPGQLLLDSSSEKAPLRHIFLDRFSETAPHRKNLLDTFIRTAFPRQLLIESSS